MQMHNIYIVIQRMAAITILYHNNIITILYIYYNIINIQIYNARPSKKNGGASSSRVLYDMIVIIIMIIINYILPVRDDADRYKRAGRPRRWRPRAWSDRPQNGRIGPGAASARTCFARRTAVSDAKTYTYPVVL